MTQKFIQGENAMGKGIYFFITNKFRVLNYF